MPIAPRLRRRLAAAITAPAVLLAGMALALPARAEVAPPPEDWPQFAYQGVITDKDTMVYNPTDEFIFPSIFHAGAHLDEPLAEWYLYYAPHDNPGGISLMYADSLEGPWTEYTENPVITNAWDPYYSVPHVSSPDAIWNEQADQMFLYFHGSNAQTRWAQSEDGLTFDYGGVAVDNDMGGPAVTETSYARVFEHPDPGSGYTYAMFYMGNETDNVRRIRLAESVDGRTWVVDPDYVVAPGEEEGQNVSGGNLWEWNDQLYVIYHASSGNVYARTIDPTLREVGAEPILLHTASGLGDDVGRIAAPEIVTDDGQTYLFYESGDRLGATIAWAKEGADVVLPPPFGGFPADPQNPVFAECSAAGSDEFEGDALAAGVWDRVVREADARHRVDDGRLVVPTYTGGVAAAPLLQQELPDGAWQVTTKVSIDATQKFQQAGLLLYADDTHYAKLDLGRATPGATVELVYHRGGQNRQDTAAPEIEGTSTIWLRYTSDGQTIRASVSYDGQTFTRYGRDIDAAEAAFTHVGPYAFRGTTAAAEIPATFDWFRFSPDADAYAACQDQHAPVQDEETAPPATGVLSSTNGWDTGLHDGSYEVQMSLWWGANASRVQLYEDGVLVGTEDLVAAGPAAQSVSFPIAGRTNGEYVYTAVLTNSQGSSSTEPLTVTVTDAEPGVAQLSYDNYDAGSDYRITANLWWGTNAETWVLYEDGEPVAEGTLEVATPAAQRVQVDLTDRAAGRHVYRIELTNYAGSTSSEPLTVTVRG